MLGVSLVTADDWILRYFASGAVGDITRLNYAKRLFAVPIAVLGQATSQASLPFFRAPVWRETDARICRYRKRVHFSHCGDFVALYQLHDGRRIALDRSGVQARTVPVLRLAANRHLFLLVLAVTCFLVGARPLCARLLRCWQHSYAYDREQRDHPGLTSCVLHALSDIFGDGIGDCIRCRNRR